MLVDRSIIRRKHRGYSCTFWDKGTYSFRQKDCGYQQCVTLDVVLAKAEDFTLQNLIRRGGKPPPVAHPA